MRQSPVHTRASLWRKQRIADLLITELDQEWAIENRQLCVEVSLEQRLRLSIFSIYIEKAVSFINLYVHKTGALCNFKIFFLACSIASFIGIKTECGDFEMSLGLVWCEGRDWEKRQSGLWRFLGLTGCIEIKGRTPNWAWEREREPERKEGKREREKERETPLYSRISHADLQGSAECPLLGEKKHSF